MWLKGESSADYFAVRCAICNGPVTLEYLGGDPSVPRVRASCDKCHKTEELELWRGLPPTPLDVSCR